MKLKINSTCMNFKDAYEALNDGQYVSLLRWVEKGVYLELDKSSTIFNKCILKDTADNYDGGLFICDPSIIINTGNKDIWLPSIDDIISTSWVTVKLIKEEKL